MDNVSLDLTRAQPARQPEAVTTGFKATAMRPIVRPAVSASSFQRRSVFRGGSCSVASFFNG